MIRVQTPSTTPNPPSNNSVQEKGRGYFTRSQRLAKEEDDLVKGASRDIECAAPGGRAGENMCRGGETRDFFSILTGA